MNEEEILEAAVNGEILSGDDAVAAFNLMRRDGWRFGVKLALLYLERGEVEIAMACLESLLEEGKPFWEVYGLPSWAEEE